MRFLCVAHDRALAELRCMVLRRTGYECAACVPSEAPVKLAHGDYNAVLLPPQITPAEAQEIIRAAAENAVIIQLHRGDAGGLLHSVVLDALGSTPQPHITH